MLKKAHPSPAHCPFWLASDLLFCAETVCERVNSSKTLNYNKMHEGTLGLWEFLSEVHEKEETLVWRTELNTSSIARTFVLPLSSFILLCDLKDVTEVGSYVCVNACLLAWEEQPANFAVPTSEKWELFSWTDSGECAPHADGSILFLWTKADTKLE